VGYRGAGGGQGQGGQDADKKSQQQRHGGSAKGVRGGAKHAASDADVACDGASVDVGVGVEVDVG
jgi:hypothetical protein